MPWEKPWQSIFNEWAWAFNGTAFYWEVSDNLIIFGRSKCYEKDISRPAGACVSPMSQPVKMVVGNLGVIAYPNPVRNYLTLLNTQNRDLQVTIVSFNGNIVYSTTFDTYSMTISTSQLAVGAYVVYLKDLVTGEKKSFTFEKL